MFVATFNQPIGYLIAWSVIGVVSTIVVFCITLSFFRDKKVWDNNDTSFEDEEAFLSDDDDKAWEAFEKYTKQSNSVMGRTMVVTSVYLFLFVLTIFTLYMLGVIPL